jgi:hypothetical protein
MHTGKKKKRMITRRRSLLSSLLALVADTARFQRPTKPKESGVIDQNSSTVFFLIIKQKPRINPQLNR